MRLALSITASVTMVLVAGTAFANTPDPNQSFFDNFLGRSPKNVEVANPTFQYVYNGTLRNAAGQPIANYDRLDVELRILSAADAPCQNPATLNPDANSDANGNIQWGVVTLDQGGGSCQGVPVVEIHVVSVGLFKTLNSVTSPDEDGNGLVDLGDFNVLRMAFNTGSPLYQGDLNGDGLVSLQDLNFFRIHFNAL